MTEISLYVTWAWLARAAVLSAVYEAPALQHWWHLGDILALPEDFPACLNTLCIHVRMSVGFYESTSTPVPHTVWALRAGFSFVGSSRELYKLILTQIWRNVEHDVCTLWFLNEFWHQLCLRNAFMEETLAQVLRVSFAHEFCA